MARPKALIPQYRLHQASGQAVVYARGRTFYLGKHDTPESRLAYSDLLARLAKEDLPVEVTNAGGDKKPSVSIAELCLRFVTDELPRFSRAEQFCQRAALRLLRELFGESPVDEFGPLKLRVLRDAMVAGDANANPLRKPWSRDTVNRMVKRVQALFRWGVSWEMVPDAVASSLDKLRILVAGETAAAESSPRMPVPQDDIDAVSAELKPLYRDILRLLCLTGARPGELMGLRMRDIDRGEAVWRAELKYHKTAHKGKQRVLYFNLEAQAVLLRHFKEKPDTKIFPCRRDNFGTAVRRACRRAKVKPFVPHQLRHTAATKLVDAVGLEAAQQVLGHSGAAMTRHYSRAAEKQAIDAVKRLG